MISGEIEVWKKGKYSPFSRFVEVVCNGKIKATNIVNTAPKISEYLDCRLRSDNSSQLTCIVDLEKKTTDKTKTIVFDFENLPAEGRTRVQGRNLLGQRTSWLCAFSASRG